MGPHLPPRRELPVLIPSHRSRFRPRRIPPPVGVFLVCALRDGQRRTSLRRTPGPNRLLGRAVALQRFRNAAAGMRGAPSDRNAPPLRSSGCPLPDAPACFVPTTTPERARHDLRHDHRRAEARQHHVRHDTEAETSSQSGRRATASCRCRTGAARGAGRHRAGALPGAQDKAVQDPDARTHRSTRDRRGKMGLGPRIAWWAVQGSNL